MIGVPQEVSVKFAMPQGVAVQLSGNKVSLKGPKGAVEKEFSPLVNISVSGNEIRVEGGKMHVNTTESLLATMAKGVTEGYKKELKLIYAHFPMSLEVKGHDVLIKNFLGEKMPRKSRLVGDTKLVSKGQSATLTGPDKEAIGQSLANLRTATRIKEKDGRVFQDGIYEIES
jgi:large subunit ribosomal protein L6